MNDYPIWSSKAIDDRNVEKMIDVHTGRLILANKEPEFQTRFSQMIEKQTTKNYNFTKKGDVPRYMSPTLKSSQRLEMLKKEESVIESARQSFVGGPKNDKKVWMPNS